MPSSGERKMFDGSWPGWTLAQSGISATAGLMGVFAGAMLTSRSQKKERKHAHIEKQLQEFYSPMLGMRQEIAAKEESRRKINEMVNTIIKKSKANDPGGVPRGHYFPDERKALIGLSAHDHKQWEEEILPLYREMLKKFTSEMWLAEPSTRAHYGELTNFVERWSRVDALTDAAEVAWRVDLSDDNVKPLYDDLDLHFTRLQKLIRE
jgi:hypothetical protein